MLEDHWTNDLEGAARAARDLGDTPLPRVHIIEVTDQAVDEGYLDAFGKTRSAALTERVCVSCGEHPTFTTEAGRREYDISGVCEPCFDRMFPDE